MSPEDVICMSNDLLELANSKSFLSQRPVDKKKMLGQSWVNSFPPQSYKEIIGSGEKGSHLSPEMFIVYIFMAFDAQRCFQEVSRRSKRSAWAIPRCITTYVFLLQTVFWVQQQSSAFFKEDHIEKIRHLLKNTTYCHPRLHSLLVCVVETAGSRIWRDTPLGAPSTWNL
ncbi:hypothetical protein PSENEW3n2_00001707 [Picochlorum sp. SENEW3]|nr:hypothetical protein PSENEW3n2_00001707 [Picochlorum sp. SENEW3]WPT14477.1 hypothetical protein PSENEW3_00001707 [Picochlorum sp. SENEW3]